MKQIKRPWIVGLMAVMFMASFIVGCENQGSEEQSSEYATTGILQVRLHDLPINGEEVEKVLVNITAAEVHSDEKGWLEVPYEANRYDLLELQDGKSVIIFKDPLEVGHYTQIRLYLGQDNEIIVDGKSYPLKIPSGEETGIKIVTPFDIEEGKIVEVTLDFDVLHSVKSRSEGYVLTPVIRLDSVAEYEGAGVATAEAGGTVSTIDGTLNINVPPGTVDEDTVFSIDEMDASTLPGTLPEGHVLIGNYYHLKPEGAMFSNPVTLEFSYNEQEVIDENNLNIVTLNEETGQWEIVPSTVIASANIISAQVPHFSTFTKTESRLCTSYPTLNVTSGSAVSYTDYTTASATSPTWYFCNSCTEGSLTGGPKDCVGRAATSGGYINNRGYAYSASHAFTCNQPSCMRYAMFSYQQGNDAKKGVTYRVNVSGSTAPYPEDGTICYQAHVEKYGWSGGWKCDGEAAGTTGQSLRLEALMIQAQNHAVCYRLHLEDTGWEPEVCNGTVAGTIAESKRAEAVKIRLLGTTAKHVCYRAHVEGIGWQAPKCDGDIAGTTGRSLRMEAVEVWISDQAL